jgi:transposase
MEAYSLDLRQRVLAAYDQGKKTAQIVEQFDVCPAWARRLKQRRRELGIIGPLPRNAGRKPKLDQATRSRLREFIAARPDATLEEIRSELKLSVSIGCLWSTLDQMDLRFKKSRSAPASSRTARTCASGVRRGTRS